MRAQLACYSRFTLFSVCVFESAHSIPCPCAADLFVVRGQLEQQAMAAEIGLHTKNPKEIANSVRSIIPPGDDGYDAKDVLELFRGQKVPMVVEQFRDGATVRGYLLPSFHWATVFLSGVSCPGFKRAEVPGAPDVADAFALEARYFVESRLLNRDVQVLLEGVDKYNNFYGTIQHPAGNISEELLKVGLGKVVDWSAKFAKDAEVKRRTSTRRGI